MRKDEPNLRRCEVESREPGVCSSRHFSNALVVASFIADIELNSRLNETEFVVL